MQNNYVKHGDGHSKICATGDEKSPLILDTVYIRRRSRLVGRIDGPSPGQIRINRHYFGHFTHVCCVTSRTWHANRLRREKSGFSFASTRSLAQTTSTRNEKLHFANWRIYCFVRFASCLLVFYFFRSFFASSFVLLLISGLPIIAHRTSTWRLMLIAHRKPIRRFGRHSHRIRRRALCRFWRLRNSGREKHQIFNRLLANWPCRNGVKRRFSKTDKLLVTNATHATSYQIRPFTNGRVPDTENKVISKCV